MFDSVPLAAPAPRELADDALIEAIPAWERLASRVAAGQLSAVAELARRRPRGLLDRPSGHVDAGHPGLPDVSEFAVDELAAALSAVLSAEGAAAVSAAVDSLARSAPAHDPRGVDERRTCRFPGCRQPAGRCDLDHVVPWPAGPTSAANLTALCRHHHRLKHQTRWRVSGEHGSLMWTSPTGHPYPSGIPSPEGTTPS